MNRTHGGTEVRPPSFLYRKAGSRLNATFMHCEGLSLEVLAKRFGTPLYVYSAATIESRLRAFDAAFRGVPHTICYSVKANSNRSILRLMSAQGCGFDVVSKGELERILSLGHTAAKKTVFSGVGKTREEISAAIKAGILLFNVESESELSALAECAAAAKKSVPIALRVNPDVPAKTHPHISTGLHKHKFGVPIRDAMRLYAEAARFPYLKIAGVSVHIGSQITDPKPFAAAMQRVADLVRQVRADGHTIRYVDAGGGLGISYEHASSVDFSRQAANYARAVIQPLRKLDVHLLLEPGRCIVGPAGVLLTRVLYKKTNDSKRFLIVDAAMNDLIRPSLYGAYHEIVPVRAPINTKVEMVDVVGPICESGDFFARNRKLSPTREGDILAILDTGAYGMALASNYNSRPRPAEVLVNRKSVRLIRRRETIKDLIGNES